MEEEPAAAAAEDEDDTTAAGFGCCCDRCLCAAIASTAAPLDSPARICTPLDCSLSVMRAGGSIATEAGEQELIENRSGRRGGSEGG